MFVSYDPNFKNSTVISDFWDKSFISIAESKEYHFLALYKAFAIEGPSITASV
jgi:hypothetical protein